MTKRNYSELQIILNEKLILQQELSNLAAILSQSGKYRGIGMSTAVGAIRRQINKL